MTYKCKINYVPGYISWGTVDWRTKDSWFDSGSAQEPIKYITMSRFIIHGNKGFLTFSKRSLIFIDYKLVLRRNGHIHVGEKIPNLYYQFVKHTRIYAWGDVISLSVLYIVFNHGTHIFLTSSPATDFTLTNFSSLRRKIS